MADFIPQSNDGFRNWVISFAGGIAADPPRYMMTVAEAAHLSKVVNDFLAAYQVAIDPETRTKGTIAAKDDALHIAKSLCRQYAKLIKDNAGIADSDKVNIGVRPINPTRRRIGRPHTQPLLNIVDNNSGVQTLRYADFTTPDSSAKPYGVTHIHLFRVISEQKNAPHSEARFVGSYTRSPIRVKYTEADDRKVATYYAQWASPQGEAGPLSLPVSKTIAA